MRVFCCLRSYTVFRTLHSSLQRWRPAPLHLSPRECLRATFGALLGIGITAALCTWALGLSADLPLLIAPMGASAVLLFAAPASPLAQPWALLGGNLVASLVGVTCAAWISNEIIAAALAVSVAIGLMLALRCLHPPSGAVALTAVLGGPSIHAAGYGFVLDPVLLNSAVLLVCALVFHTFSRHRYPHGHVPNPVAARAVSPASQQLHQALQAVLDERDEFIDVDADDLEAIVTATLARLNQEPRR
ncbi:HPP family protein [Pseudomonas silvicola]|nr:HPP family protein [Pseudomonas silvicola]